MTAFSLSDHFIFEISGNVKIYYILKIFLKLIEIIIEPSSGITLKLLYNCESRKSISLGERFQLVSCNRQQRCAFTDSRWTELFHSYTPLVICLKFNRFKINFLQFLIMQSRRIDILETLYKSKFMYLNNFYWKSEHVSFYIFLNTFFLSNVYWNFSKKKIFFFINITNFETIVLIFLLYFRLYYIFKWINFVTKTIVQFCQYMINLNIQYCKKKYFFFQFFKLLSYGIQSSFPMKVKWILCIISL